VPDVDAWFWVTKLLTTAFGEAAADFAAVSINPYIAVCLVGLIFVVAMIIQFRSRYYRPGTYWFAAAMVASFGTMMADAVHVQFGVSYAASSGFLTVCLAVVFIVWFKVEGTLSIHSIVTRRREAFYWSTIIVTFALGTAAGDLAASIGNMGYLKAALVFAIAIMVPALMAAITRGHVIGWFWMAYVITRPLGASFADWFSKPASVHGLGLGDGNVALVLGGLIIFVLVTMTLQQRRYAPAEQQLIFDDSDTNGDFDVEPIVPARPTATAATPTTTTPHYLDDETCDLRSLLVSRYAIGPMSNTAQQTGIFRDYASSRQTDEYEHPIGEQQLTTARLPRIT